MVLVQTKLYGTILVDNHGGIYNIESFDFESETKNHSPEPLAFRMGRLCKKVRREGHLTHRMESFSSFCSNEGVIYLVSTNCNNELTVNLHWFDVKNKTWVKCYTFDAGFKPRISQTFIYQNNVYVIVQEIKTHIGTPNTSEEISNSSDQRMNQDLYRFDASTNSITRVDIKLPSSLTFSVIPAYFVIHQPRCS